MLWESPGWSFQHGHLNSHHADMSSHALSSITDFHRSALCIVLKNYVNENFHRIKEVLSVAQLQSRSISIASIYKANYCPKDVMMIHFIYIAMNIDHLYRWMDRLGEFFKMILQMLWPGWKKNERSITQGLYAITNYARAIPTHWIYIFIKATTGVFNNNVKTKT